MITILFLLALKKLLFTNKISFVSYEKYLNNKFILYDLGMEEKQIEFLKNNHKQVEIRTFNCKLSKVYRYIF